MLKGCVYFLNFLVISALLSVQVVSCIFQEQSGESVDVKEIQHNDNHKHGANSLHNGSFVGFTAWKQSRQEYEEGDIIVFDGITLNEGGHYDTTSNSFTCPVDGIYFVSVTAGSYDTIHRTDLDIVVQGQQIYHLVNIDYYNPFDMVTNSGLFLCPQNERVWVEATDDGVVGGEPGIPYTTFTVFLMQQKDLMHASFMGFSAGKSFEQEYVGKETITYEEALVNEGGLYLPEVSRFYCPVSGVYYTTINSYRYDCSSFINLGVSLNSIFILHSRILPENCASSVSNSRLFRCTEGDFVAVQGLGNGRVSGYTDLILTTFTTMLMYQSETDAGAQHSTFVGFSAFKQTEQTYNVGDTIIFEGVLLNEGEGYQPLFGRFICPANGIYYVAVTVTRQGVEDLLVDVEYQTDVLFRLSSTESANPYNSISNSALVSCFNGEEISVKAAGSGSILGVVSEALSVFTVMKMFEY